MWAVGTLCHISKQTSLGTAMWTADDAQLGGEAMRIEVLHRVLY